MTALRSARFVDLLDRLVEAAREPVLSAEAARPGGEVLQPLVRRNWRKLARDARALQPDSPFEDYHRVRVRAKRARYAAEAVAPVLNGEAGAPPSGSPSAPRMSRTFSGYSRTLWSHASRSSPLPSPGPSDGPFNLAAGRMLEREGNASERARAEFPAVWKQLDKQKVRRWLTQ